MKKVIRLTESDLEQIVTRVIKEQISAGTYTKPSYESRVYDTNNPGFGKFLNSIKADLQNKQQNYKVAGGKTPEYNAMVRDVAGLSTLTFDKTKKEWVETPGYGMSTFQEREKQILKYMDDVSKAVAERAKEKSYPFYVWVMTKKVGELLNGLQGKKNPTIVMDDIESVKKVPMPQPKVSIPSMLVDDKKIPLNSKFKIGSPLLEESYKNDFPSFIQQAFAKAVEEYKSGYKDLEFPGAVYVSGIKVTSSSSTIPHGKNMPERYQNAEGSTEGFKNLSEDRGKALLNFILQFIKSDKNIVTDNNTRVSEIDFLGENGDGTSGPKWNSDAYKANPTQYTENQKAFVTLEFAAIPKPPIPEPVPDLQINDFSIRASGEGRKGFFIDLDLPEINLPSLNIGGLLTRGSGRDIACPIFWN
jgi:hypothetical protein